MKFTSISIFALVGASNALPFFNWPSSTGSGTGTSATTPSTGSGFDWSNFFNGGGANSGGDNPASPTVSKAPSSPLPSSSPGGGTGGNTGGSGTIGANCTPQGAGGRATENGIVNKNCCTDMTVIFARGTTESGNVGSVTGPPMFAALRQKLGADRVTVQGVDYAASFGGIMNQGGDGGKTMATLVQTALTQCPSTKIIVSGYSQGGMVVHNAFRNGLSASQVAGAVLFGDPMKRQAVGDLPTSSVKQFCGPSDNVCGGGGDGGATGGHLSYGSSADAAATFAIQAAGLA